MSTATGIRNPFFGWQDSYEPVSEGSRVIQRLSVSHANYRRGSATDWSPLVEAALLQIRTECRRSNWDGGGAIPISDITIDLATELVGYLFAMVPNGTPAPDLVPEADGEISLTWEGDAERVFALSVGASGKVNFSGQFGREGSWHGWEPIDPTNQISFKRSLDNVAKLVPRVYSDATGGRRA